MLHQLLSHHNSSLGLDLRTPSDRYRGRPPKRRKSPSYLYLLSAFLAVFCSRLVGKVSALPPPIEKNLAKDIIPTVDSGTMTDADGLTDENFSTVFKWTGGASGNVLTLHFPEPISFETVLIGKSGDQTFDFVNFDLLSGNSP